MSSRLFKVPEAAALLAVSLPTAWTMTYDGRIPVVRMGHVVRVKPSTLAELGVDLEGAEEFLASRKAKAAASS